MKINTIFEKYLPHRKVNIKAILLMLLTGIVFSPVKAGPDNIAPQAKVTASSSLNAECGPQKVTDGITTVAGQPKKILFIGNSLTYKQDGIYSHLEKLAAAAAPPCILLTEKSVKGGATLKTHWERPEPREAIIKADCDVVVLQEDLPEINVSYFQEYARRFVLEIRKAKSRPILLMAWYYPRLGWISTAEIARAHRDIAKELDVEVAPVGLAWQRSIKKRPDLDLYIADLEHPSIYGTYLATCVVYATLFGKSPVGLGYTPSGISNVDAAFLQYTAWATYQKWTRKFHSQSSHGKEKLSLNVDAFVKSIMT